MKNKILRNISLGIACLLGIGGAITAASVNKQEAVPSKAEEYYLLDSINGEELRDAYKASGWSTSFQVTDTNGTWACNTTDSLSTTITSAGMYLADNDPSTVLTLEYTNTSSNYISKAVITATSYESPHSSTSITFNGTTFQHTTGETPLDHTDTTYCKSHNTLLEMVGPNVFGVGQTDLYGFTISIYYSPASPVTITGGTGVKSVYLSTNSTATSGSASGTPFGNGATVYGFAELAKGYKHPSGWTKVSGTADTEGAKYRVGSVTAGSSNFGTKSADLITYSISYNLNGGTHGSTHPNTYYVTTNTFTISNPTKTGYTFAGWSGTGITGTSTSVTVSKGSIGNRSYTANWTLKPEIQTVINNINNIGNVTYPGSRSAINTARTGYNNLNQDYKALVSNYSTLTAAESTYNTLRTNAINNLINQIDSLGEITYPSSKEAIVAAENAYDALYSGDRSEITNYETLTDARSVFDELRQQAIDEVIGAINAIGDVNYPSSKAAIENAENLYSQLHNDDKNSTVIPNQSVMFGDRDNYDEKRDEAVAQVILNINSISKPFDLNAYDHEIATARDSYEALDEDEKNTTWITNYQTLLDAEEARLVTKEILAIDPTLEPAAYEEAVKTARSHYEALTSDQKDFIPPEVYKILTDHEEAWPVVKLINDIGDLTYDGGEKDSLKAIETAEEAYKVLSADQKVLVDKANHDTLVYDRNTYDDVEEACNLIANIGEVKHDEETKTKLDATRGKYDSLNEEAKALVALYDNSYKTLVDDEAIYNALVMIDSIGDITYDEDCKERLDDARATYDALTDDQKTLIKDKDLKTLTDDEATYEAVEKINEIGNIYYDYESKERIDEARAYYESLTEEQKALVNPEYLKLLQDSEQDFSTKETTGNILVIVFLILSCLLLAGGLIVLYLLLKKKKNNDNEDKNGGKPVTAASFSFPLILVATSSTSHYLDAPYIALYIIAGLTILVWLTDLIIHLYKRHQKKVTAIQSSLEENNEESEIVTDESGNRFVIRYIKSFLAKLIQSSDEVKAYYKELKNFALSYEGTSSRVSWHYDSINVGKIQFLKFGIRGKKLCLYLPLNPDELDEKYKVERIESLKYEKVPCMYRIDSERRLRYAKSLIRMVVSKLKLKLGEEQHEEYSFPYEDRDSLIARGLIRVNKSLEGQPNEEVLSVEEDEEGNEVITTQDTEGHVYETRFVKSFTARLIQSDDEAKHLYQELKNYALSYSGVTARLSWLYDSINLGRNQLLKFNIRGKTLCIYYALDTEKLGEKYKVEKVESKKYASVPCLYRINNPRRLNYAKELIDRIMRKHKLIKDKELNDNYYLPYEEKDALIKKGYIRESKIRIK